MRRPGDRARRGAAGQLNTPGAWSRGVRARVRRRWRLWRLAARNRAAATTCFYCGAGFAGTGARQRTVDHRVPLSAGGTDGLANLVFACRSCNQRKGDTAEGDFTASEWLARRRAEIERAGGR